MILNFFNTAAARLLLCVGIAAALAMVASDRLLYRTSIDAVVNAPRIEVVAPAEGVITALPITPGLAVSGGATVAALQRTTWSQGVVDEIGLRVTQQRARVAALEKEIGTLHTLRSELRVRIVGHRASSVAQLQDEERSLTASAQEQRLSFERIKALHATGSATNAELEAASAAAVRSAAALARMQEVRRAVAAGIVTEQLGGGAQDVPYSQQRVDDLTIQLARLVAERAMATAELEELERRLTVRSASDTSAASRNSASTPFYQAAGEGSATITLSSHSGGVVWAVPHALGSIVMKGAVVATLVNCADAFLEARISPRDGAAVQPGHPVTFRFAGEATERRGTVAYVRGGSIRDDIQTVARLATQARAEAEGRVVIAPDPSTMDATPTNSCHIGRSAKVTFGRRGTGTQSLAAR